MILERVERIIEVLWEVRGRINICLFGLKKKNVEFKCKVKINVLGSFLKGV